MKNVFFSIFGFLVIIGSIYLFLNKPSERKLPIRTLSVGNTILAVEIADTPISRGQGLSGRKNLSEGQGMFFIMESPGRYGFWMKGMNFPIDIIWIDENLVVTGIDAFVSPSTFPKIFYPKQDIMYVLEIPAGFTKKYGIDIGNVVQLLEY